MTHLLFCAVVTLGAEHSSEFTKYGERVEHVEPEDRNGAKPLDEWVIQATGSRSEQFRTEAATALEKIVANKRNMLTEQEQKACRSGAVGMLKLKDAYSRQVGIRCLAALPHLDDLDAITAAAKDKDLAVSSAAIEALGKLRSDSAIPVLVEAVSDRTSERLMNGFGGGFEHEEKRCAAAAALGAIGTPAAKEALTKLEKRQLPKNVKEAVLAALDAIDAK